MQQQHKTFNPRFAVLASMILLAAFSRCIPHMPNFSPLGAMSLFGAAYFTKKWQAFLVPIAATFLSNLYINNVIYAANYPHFIWISKQFYWVYGSYILITIAGFLILKKITVSGVLFASLASTAIFFLITNFACWPGNSLYSQDISGLFQSYAAGLPFLKGTLLGDLFYSTVMFGSYALLEKRFPRLRHV